MEENNKPDEVVEEVQEEAPIDEPSETSEEEEEDEPVEDEPFEIDEPKVRKSPKDYILERRSKRLAKFEEGKAGGEDDDFEDDEEDDPNDIRNIVKKELDRRLKPIAETMGNQSFDQELGEVMKSYPELNGKEAELKKYAEAYPTTPLEFIAQGLLFKKYSTQAGRQQAQQKAKSEQKGGNVKRPKTAKEKSAWDMTEEEFLQNTNKVRSGQFKG